MSVASLRPRPAAAARRLSRRFVARLGPAPRVAPGWMWTVSAWVGLVFGLAESVLYLGWQHLGPRVGDPDLWVNWHKPWLAPLGLAAWAFGLGIVASLVHVVLPRLTTRLLPPALVGLGAWSALGTIPGLAPWAVRLLALGLAVRLGGRLRLDCPATARLVRRGLPLAAGTWLALFVATGVMPATREARTLAFAPAATPGAPNVLLVVLDTVRADHLGHHGYGRPTSPNLDRLAARGATFLQARSTTPYTLGTHASLFTGRWMSETSARVDTPLDAAHPTLAEHLRDRGYATAAFTGNIFYGSARYGLDRGFLRYHDVPGNITRRVTARELLRSCSLGEALVLHLERKWRILDPLQRRRLDAAELNREALAWLDTSRPADRPFFLFLNYFDAHAPYTLPGAAPQPFSRRLPERLESRLKAVEGDAADPDERARVLADVADAYDDGIAWIDRQLDALLSALDRRGLLANTLVVVTADHGEMLGEHGLFGHGQTLHRPVVHVPLVVRGASGGKPVPAGVRLDRPVSVRDVPATILDLLGDPRPDRFPGRSLARCWAPTPAAVADDPVLSEVQGMPWLRRSPRMPVSYGPLGLLTEGDRAYHRQAHETAGVQERLFDLAADPGESRDLAAAPAEGATLETLRARLNRALPPAAGAGR